MGINTCSLRIEKPVNIFRDHPIILKPISITYHRIYCPDMRPDIVRVSRGSRLCASVNYHEMIYDVIVIVIEIRPCYRGVGCCKVNRIYNKLLDIIRIIPIPVIVIDIICMGVGRSVPAMNFAVEDIFSVRVLNVIVFE